MPDMHDALRESIQMGLGQPDDGDLTPNPDDDDDVTPPPSPQHQARGGARSTARIHAERANLNDMSDFHMGGPVSQPTDNKPKAKRKLRQLKKGPGAPQIPRASPDPGPPPPHHMGSNGGMNAPPEFPPGVRPNFMNHQQQQQQPPHGMPGYGNDHMMHNKGMGKGGSGPPPSMRPDFNPPPSMRPDFSPPPGDFNPPPGGPRGMRPNFEPQSFEPPPMHGRGPMPVPVPPPHPHAHQRGPVPVPPPPQSQHQQIRPPPPPANNSSVHDMARSLHNKDQTAEEKMRLAKQLVEQMRLRKPGMQQPSSASAPPPPPMHSGSNDSIGDLIQPPPPAPSEKMQLSGKGFGRNAPKAAIRQLGSGTINIVPQGRPKPKAPGKVEPAMPSGKLAWGARLSGKGSNSSNNLDTSEDYDPTRGGAPPHKATKEEVDRMTKLLGFVSKIKDGKLQLPGDVSGTNVKGFKRASMNDDGKGKGGKGKGKGFKGGKGDDDGKGKGKSKGFKGDGKGLTKNKN